LASRSWSFSRSQSGVGPLDLLLDLADAALDVVGRPGTLDNGGVVLGDGDPPGPAEQVER
jgi:hypothetical protein